MSTGQGIHNAARLLGRRGGLKGGPARAAVLSKIRRKKIARKGGLARQGSTKHSEER